MCRDCATVRSKEPLELIGPERERVINEFMVWFGSTENAWERATHGLCMFVRQDGRAFWP
jgi:hypothetical protein